RQIFLLEPPRSAILCPRTTRVYFKAYGTYPQGICGLRMGHLGGRASEAEDPLGESVSHHPESEFRPRDSEIFVRLRSQALALAWPAFEFVRRDRRGDQNGPGNRRLRLRWRRRRGSSRDRKAFERTTGWRKSAERGNAVGSDVRLHGVLRTAWAGSDGP